VTTSRNVLQRDFATSLDGLLNTFSIEVELKQAQPLRCRLVRYCYLCEITLIRAPTVTY